MARTLKDAAGAAKRLVREMQWAGEVTDPAGAEVWKWSAVDDYARLLEDAPNLTPEEFEARQESVEMYAAKAEAAGVNREWLESQFYRVRQDWARAYDKEHHAAETITEDHPGDQGHEQTTEQA